MIYKFYIDTRFNKNQQINKNDYDEFILNINNYKFEKNKIKYNKITATTISFNLTTNLNIDFVEIIDFPFYNKGKTYFTLSDKKFVSSNNGDHVYQFIFTLAPFITFTFDEMFNGNSIHITNKHIDERKEFEDFDKLKLNKENLFQKDLPSPDNMFIKTKKIKNKLLTADEIKNKDNKKYTTKWVIAVINGEGEDFTEFPKTYLIPTPKFEIEGLDIDERIPTNNIFTTFPLTNELVDIYDPKGNLLITLDPKQLLEYLADNPSLLSWILLDHTPDDGLVWNEKLNGWVSNEPSPAKKIHIHNEIITGDNGLAIEKQPTSWLLFGEISKRLITTHMMIEDKKFLFDYVEPTNIFDGLNDNTILQNCIQLNFSPYKTFSVGIFGETSESGWKFSLNNFIYLKPEFLFKRTFNTTMNIFELWDSIEHNVYYGEIQSKTKRDLFLEQYTDAWKEQNKNKKLNGATNFLVPALTMAAALFIPGGKVIKGAALIGSLASGTNTLLKNNQTRNTPDTQTQSATEINGELINHFETRTLSIYEPTDEVKKLIAQAYHLMGASFSDKPFIFNNNFAKELYNIKLRFNFLKINSSETTRIFNNTEINLFETQKLILEILTQGITFWNYDKDWDTILKNYNFNYMIKNPNKDIIKIKEKK